MSLFSTPVVSPSICVASPFRGCSNLGRNHIHHQFNLDPSPSSMKPAIDMNYAQSPTTLRTTHAPIVICNQGITVEGCGFPCS